MKSMLAKMGLMFVLLGASGGWGCATIDGADGTDVGDEDVREAASALCEGWEAGARNCSAKCSDDGWYHVGQSPSVPYGGCQEAAMAKCSSMGRGYRGSCWSF